MLHKFKDLNFGFVIIAPEHNIGNIMCTVRTIKNNYQGIQHICVVGNNTSTDEIKELNGVCLTIKGKNTITSLINCGIKKGCKEWNVIVMEGTPVKKGIDKKYSLFVENEKDVLFPIIMDYNRDGMPSKIRSSFEEASLNGMMIHQKTFKTVGDFVDAPIPTSKFMWALGAAEIGCKFKGVLGTALM
jgi:hypothetical protein